MRIAWVAMCLLTMACATRRDRAAGGDAGTRACDTEGAHRCVGSTYEVCTGGQFVTEIECPTACLDELGCVVCQPGTPFCNEGNVWVCDDAGQPGSELEVCGGQTTCIGGGCADACEDAANSKSYIGCEYWAVDLDNAAEVWGIVGQGGGGQMTAGECTSLSGVQVTAEVCFGVLGQSSFSFGFCDPPTTMGGAKTCPSGLTCGSRTNVCISDAQRSPFAIVVSNPQARDVNVTVEGPGGQIITQVVAAGQVTSIAPQAGGAIPDQSVDGSLRERRAYKLTSDLPIVAYQFNPLDNVNVFSNDASLLIPRTVFDVDYYVMTRATLDRRTPAPGTNSYYGYLTVVAWQDNTQIAITPTAAVTAGPTTGPIAAGATANFTLNAFDVLQLQAAGAGDLTGTHVVSTNATTFGVFGGHEATAFGETTPPDGGHTAGPCCADHLEEMLFPSTTWGKEFAIARSQPRANESDVLRILAQKAGTTVTFTPAPVSGTCGTLGAGQFCEVKIAGDTEIVATEPILIGHFLQSAIWSDTQGPNTGPIGNGDPSMAIAVPIEQYRKDYTILVPAQYDQSFISISAVATGGVTVDGTAVTMTTFTGGGTNRVARIPVTAGQHRITCADGCSVLVYGYSNSVSYMFAGGLDLKQIVIL
jgi:hypothetical protein